MESKRRIIITLGAGLFFIFALAVIGGEAEDMKTKAGTEIKSKITLEPSFKAKKPSVEFTHQKHFKSKEKEGLGYKCAKCHHKREEDKDPRKCGTCHKEKKDGDTPSYKKAYHELCKDCHKKDENKETKAPKKCKECHKKTESE